MATFAEQLSKVRKEHQLTQEQLAKELNISRTTISRWESGRALPDIGTIKKLSQLLNHNFFSVDDLADEPVAAPAKASAKKTERLSQRILPLLAKADKKVWRLAGGALCLLILCLALLPWLLREPAQKASATVTPTVEATAEATPSPGITPTAAPTSVPTATPTAAPTATPTAVPTATPTAVVTQTQLPRAEIVVTTSVEEAYLIPFGDQGNYGWDVSFYFANVGDVPFTPERIIADYYEGSRLASSIVLTYSDLRPWMGNDKLIKGNDPLHWPFGSNQRYMTHMEATIIGTDDNGNVLQASATVRYVNEYAAGTLTPTPQPTATPTTAPSAANEGNQLPRAEIVVTTSVEEAYLIPFGDPGNYGWDVSFYFANVGDVPFTPERIIADYYEGNRLAASIVLTYSDLRPWMHNDKLIKGNDPLHWPFSTNQLYMTHMKATIIGTDDNGNVLQASATVRYVNEYAAGTQP